MSPEQSCPKRLWTAHRSTAVRRSLVPTNATPPKNPLPNWGSQPVTGPFARPRARRGRRRARAPGPGSAPRAGTGAGGRALYPWFATAGAGTPAPGWAAACAGWHRARAQRLSGRVLAPGGWRRRIPGAGCRAGCGVTASGAAPGAPLPAASPGPCSEAGSDACWPGGGPAYCGPACVWPGYTWPGYAWPVGGDVLGRGRRQRAWPVVLTGVVLPGPAGRRTTRRARPPTPASRSDARISASGCSRAGCSLESNQSLVSKGSLGAVGCPPGDFAASVSQDGAADPSEEAPVSPASLFQRLERTRSARSRPCSRRPARSAGGLQVLVGEQLRVGVGGVNRGEHGLHRLGLALRREEAGCC